MMLTDFFSGGQFKSSGTQRTNVPQRTSSSFFSGRTAESSTSAAQLHALKPGQTLQGEVVSRDGNQVQIKLDDDSVVEAKVDQDMNLQVGKTMTFEVRNNGQNLTLSPLFENTATQANALKALEMASLPVSQTTVSMTGMMMEAGLPVDRNSLQQMFREVNSFPGANVSDVVDLHKLGLAVNEENLTQISSYKNLTHQLVDGMHTVLQSMPESMEGMVADGNVEGAARMFQDMLDMIRELPSEETNTADQLPGTPQEMGEAAAETHPGDTRTLAAETLGQEQHTPEGIDHQAQTSGKIVISDNPETAQGTQTAKNAADVLMEEIEASGDGAEHARAQSSNLTQSTFTNELAQLVRNTGADTDTYAPLLRTLSDAMQSGTTADQAKALQQLVQQGLQDKNNPLLEGLLQNKGAQKLLTDGLSKLWTIEPKDVADADKVEELYSRLNRQLNHLSNALEENGQQHSAAFKAVNNMTQNIDFLQQLNQAYTYVQLPLRLQQGDAHGDLYVYTNKRNLAAKDGQISALLHLDMENLGPVDVYVAMQAEHVNTRFYVQDDEMLDFLEAHMDLLTQRLTKRGYDCSFAMQTRDKGAAPESGLNGLTEQNAKPIAQYAFDVRA